MSYSRISISGRVKKQSKVARIGRNPPYRIRIGCKKKEARIDERPAYGEIPHTKCPAYRDLTVGANNAALKVVHPTPCSDPLPLFQQCDITITAVSHGLCLEAPSSSAWNEKCRTFTGGGEEGQDSHAEMASQGKRLDPLLSILRNASDCAGANLSAKCQ